MLNKFIQKFKSILVWFRPRYHWGVFSISALAVLVLTVILITTPSAAAGLTQTVQNIFADINFAISRLFLSLTLFLLTFIIQIAGYNGYIDSVAVSVGWVMVRDLCNMAFVVFLLIIAFGTILGLEQYEWKKLMAKFVMAAILVNFSRVICGVMIDVAQVFMTTFVNGIAATAGGNLINAFSADKLYTFSQTETGDTINAGETLIASIAAVIFAGMMMMTMFAIGIMLLFRMVVLWVLVVLSPMAFVLNVIPKTESYAKQWWDEFGKNLVAGPILIFFIWLSFVTVGGGDVAKEIEDNNISKKDTSAEQPKSGISEIMEWEKLTSFAIAIGMLLVGAKVTQQFSPYGGEFVQKAKDFGKKTAMIASGVATGMWAYNKGVKPAAKWTAMKMPFVGGDAWMARGKSIGGRLATKFQKFQIGRDKFAQDLEAEKKAQLDAQFKLRTGQYKDEKERTKLEKTASGGDSNFWSRNLKNILAGGLETQGRGMARADDWIDAAKKMKEVREKEYSKSSAPGGYAKLEADVALDMATKMAEGKKTRKKEELASGITREETKKAEPLIEQEKEAVKRKEAAEKEGDVEAVAKIKIEIKKLQNQISGGRAAKAVKATIQGETQAEARKDADVQLRELIQESSGLGHDFFAAKASAKFRTEGHHSKEELELMEAELHQMEHEIEEMNKEGKTEEANKLTARLTAGRDALQVLSGMDRVEKPEVGLADAKAKLAAATTARQSAQKDHDIAPIAEKSAAQARLYAAQQQEAEAQQTVDKAQEYEDAMQNSGKNAMLNVDALQTVMEQLLKGKTEGENTTQIASRIKNDTTQLSALQAMFGLKDVEELMTDKKNQLTLERILETIKSNKSTLTNKTNGEALNIISNNIQGGIATDSHGLTDILKKQTKKYGSQYAASSLAQKDHEYAFYRGKKTAMKDQAGQLFVWDDMGIQTPTGAAQETIVDGLYKQHFASMIYDQALAAKEAHQRYMQGKKDRNEKITEKDKLISQAIFAKLFEQSWVDDATIATFDQNFGLDVKAIKKRPKKSGNGGRGSPGTVNLTHTELENFADAIAGLNLNQATVNEYMTTDTSSTMSHFEDSFRRIHDRTISDDTSGKVFGGRDTNRVLHDLRNLPADQRAVILNKLK